MAGCRPLRCCWPSAAAGPDRVVMRPIFSFSCAIAADDVAAIAAAATSIETFNLIARSPESHGHDRAGPESRATQGRPFGVSDDLNFNSKLVKVHGAQLSMLSA